MDFLEIRRKARERAGATPAASGSPSVTGDLPAAPASGPPPAEAQVAAPGTAAQAERGRATDGELPPADAARFTTWRPGAGAPPLPIDHSALRPAARPAPEPPTVAPPLPPRVVALAPPAAPPRGPGALDAFFYREDEDLPADALGLPTAAAAAEAAPVVLEEYLTFRLGAEEYAIAIERVREVLKPPPVTEVPRAPGDILGVVTVRGEVVAVIDPRARLGLPTERGAGAAPRVVLVDAGEGVCGLLVDAVSNVVRLRPGSIEPRPQGIGGQSADCLAGIGRDRDRIFTVLDLGVLLRRAAPGRAAEGRAHGAA